MDKTRCCHEQGPYLLGGLFLAQQAATGLGALGALVLILGLLIVLNGAAAALSWRLGA
jgi:hypothetical protein